MPTVSNLFGSEFMNRWENISQTQDFINQVCDSLQGSNGSGLFGSSGIYGSLLGSRFTTEFFNGLTGSGIENLLSGLLGSYNLSFGSGLSFGSSAYGSGVHSFDLLHSLNLEAYSMSGSDWKMKAFVALLGAGITGNYGSYFGGLSYQGGYGLTVNGGYNGGYWSTGASYNSDRDTLYVNGQYNLGPYSSLYGEYFNNHGEQGVNTGVKYNNSNFSASATLLLAGCVTAMLAFCYRF